WKPYPLSPTPTDHRAPHRRRNPFPSGPRNLRAASATAAGGAMILSALATSVGFNLAFTVLLAAAYTLLRGRPAYVEVYAPRRPYAPLEPWLPAAWRRSEEDIHAAAGLDGVVFIRIFIFSIRVFAAAAVLGVGVLLPVNFMGDQLQTIDFSDLPNKSIDHFSVSNVQDGSNMLWLHFSAVYILTGITCYLLY
ncbi:unnamed protein product, partial [Urochloa humidicola]